ncbi:hypothetical protein [Paraburkholderia sp. SIMBA_054]|uniref:hypothetical protein n=1 Tax=Paraburkholderia sp. SIMBA_054 TaxID=3085795 RepID=UPI0039789051
MLNTHARTEQSSALHGFLIAVLAALLIGGVMNQQTPVLSSHAAPQDWQPSFSPWRHGGWYVHNVRYPAGSIGCVSNNYRDKKWRIVCDPRRGDLGEPGDHTFKTRNAAARAEFELAAEAHARMPEWFREIPDVQLRYVAAGLFERIDANPTFSLADEVKGACRARGSDEQALFDIATRYLAERNAENAGVIGDEPLGFTQ